MNTQQGLGILLSLTSEYAARRRRSLEAIRDEMRIEILQGNVDGAIELAKELKNWGSK